MISDYDIIALKGADVCLNVVGYSSKILLLMQIRNALTVIKMFTTPYGKIQKIKIKK